MKIWENLLRGQAARCATLRHAALKEQVTSFPPQRWYQLQLMPCTKFLNLLWPVLLWYLWTWWPSKGPFSAFRSLTISLLNWPFANPLSGCSLLPQNFLHAFDVRHFKGNFLQLEADMLLVCNLSFWKYWLSKNLYLSLQKYWRSKNLYLSL